MSPNTLRLVKHKQITGTLTCRSGLRIGGSKEDIEIGGVDSPIVRDPVSGLPYIPGSSLKGKLRSLLEYYREGGIAANGEPCGCGKPSCQVCTVFGPHKRTQHDLGPTRIIVRDAPLSEESQKRLEPLREQGIDYAEVKHENWIDRRTGVAGQKGLRNQERVLASAQFDLTIHIRIFEGDPEAEIVALVERGLKGLEAEYLGGSGSRGYGWVKVDYTVSDVP